MSNTYFLHQIKKTKGVFDKGIVVKETLEAAKQSYHAYLAAYAYGNNEDTNYGSCEITDLYGRLAVGPETRIGSEEEPSTEG